MQPLAALLIEERIKDLLRDADDDRRANAVLGTGRPQAAWRRWSGGAARRLSVALETVAVELDPSVSRPSYGRE